MKAKENYENLAKSFAQVFDEINELVKNPSVTIDHRQYKVILYLCCDYKVSLMQNNINQCVGLFLKMLLEVLGLNAAHSTYACMHMVQR